MAEDREDNVEPEDAISQATTGYPSAQANGSMYSGHGAEEIKQLSHESITPQNSYQIKPSFQDM